MTINVGPRWAPKNEFYNRPRGFLGAYTSRRRLTSAASNGPTLGAKIYLYNRTALRQ
jgi:hypothetical protein